MPPYTRDPLTLHDDIEDFILDRRARNLSPATVRFYMDRLSRFVEYLESEGITTTAAITPAVLRAYLLELSETCNAGGVAANFRAVRAFLRWWAQEHDFPRSAITKVQPPRARSEPLPPVSTEHFTALLEACRVRSHSNDRDRALFMFLLDTGVRASELTSLSVGDLDMREGSVLVRHGKGDRQRTVFVGVKTLRELRRYLRRRRPDPDDPIFATVDGRRLNRYGLRQILRRRSSRAGIPRPALHSFRRAFAINSLRNGMDVFSLQKLMGHADLTVLRRYLAQTREDLQSAHERAGPVDKLL